MQTNEHDDDITYACERQHSESRFTLTSKQDLEGLAQKHSRSSKKSDVIRASCADIKQSKGNHLVTPIET
ncbi:hypothetical protein DPMN_147823 [Dreissena polymorpha]|uniref:Uncharacterized protein n=1 Tax=Dreissena polymorpha TaxID=45954 RepID=A0A9D4F9Q1_DREPO|nr:hypothetical protein DPMN_147823 [Dreissena polymorpha]